MIWSYNDCLLFASKFRQTSRRSSIYFFTTFRNFYIDADVIVFVESVMTPALCYYINENAVNIDTVKIFLRDGTFLIFKLLLQMTLKYFSLGFHFSIDRESIVIFWKTLIKASQLAT